jgi:hypothetical protein
LRAGNLIVIKLHGIDGAAAKFIVLCIRPEDRTQQDARATSLWVGLHRMFMILLGRSLPCDLGHRLKNNLHATKTDQSEQVCPR